MQYYTILYCILYQTIKCYTILYIVHTVPNPVIQDLILYYLRLHTMFPGLHGEPGPGFGSDVHRGVSLLAALGASDGFPWTSLIGGSWDLLGNPLGPFKGAFKEEYRAM